MKDLIDILGNSRLEASTLLHEIYDLYLEEKKDREYILIDELAIFYLDKFWFDLRYIRYKSDNVITNLDIDDEFAITQQLEKIPNLKSVLQNYFEYFEPSIGNIYIIKNFLNSSNSIINFYNTFVLFLFYYFDREKVTKSKDCPLMSSKIVSKVFDLYQILQSMKKDLKEKTENLLIPNLDEFFEIIKDKPYFKWELVLKLISLLDDIDKDRINIDSYTTKRIFSQDLGHWDLYQNESYFKNIVNEILIKDNNEEVNAKDIAVYGRDPRLDIVDGGIVGIDFGTKSTVVVRQGNDSISIPMRISGNSLHKITEKSDFENPTIIEFKDLQSFFKDYKFVAGRPWTTWDDLPVSHVANADWIGNTAVNTFNSFLYDLKQWAANRKTDLYITDQKNYRFNLRPFLEQTEDDIDPIEIYAYYIGSYINNMNTGIYLEYHLSYPISYDFNLRDKLIKSFKKGIQKSLPQAILEDENIMKRFKVVLGASEPAAYAICALKEFQIEPEEGKDVRYGVFDFGGGTTDFDFGIWRYSEDERNYDYELERFGDGGCKFLGGENILRELAYEIFKLNGKCLIENQCCFTKPSWCKSFIEEDVLIKDSPASHINTKLLMEKLRPFWENSQENKDDSNAIKVNLITKENKVLSGVELELDTDLINKIIKDRITAGIEDFFIALNKNMPDIKDKKLCIFLAGNSTKNPFVKEIFEQKIKEYNIEASIYPGLGTKEAIETIKGKDSSFIFNEIESPTAKTGVAYGLIDWAASGRIKIINKEENKENIKNVKFKFFVGYESRHKFKAILTPQFQYHELVYLNNVNNQNVFNVFYTSEYLAEKGNLPITSVKRKRIALKDTYDSSCKINIKPIAPNKIVYQIQKDEENKNVEEGEILLD